MVAAVLAPHQHSPSPSHQQELLFKKLFGNEETDLIDESEAEGAAGGEASGEAGDGAKPPPAAMALEIKEGETAAAFARRVFRAVFEEDVQRLLSMVPSRTPRTSRPHAPHAPSRPGLVVEGACQAHGAAAGGHDAARCRLPRRGRVARLEPRGERSGPPRRLRPPSPPTAWTWTWAYL